MERSVHEVVSVRPKSKPPRAPVSQPAGGGQVRNVSRWWEPRMGVSEDDIDALDGDAGTSPDLESVQIRANHHRRINHHANQTKLHPPLLAAGAAAVAIAPHRSPRPRPPAPQSRPGQPCIRPRAIPRSPLCPTRLRNRPPSCSNHSAGIWAPCYSTTPGAGAGPGGTENDCELAAAHDHVAPEHATRNGRVRLSIRLKAT